MSNQSSEQYDRHELDDLRDRLNSAEKALTRVGELADWFEAQPNWVEWGVHRQIRLALNTSRDGSCVTIDGPLRPNVRRETP